MSEPGAGTGYSSPLISILSAVRNEAQWIDQMLESVVSQPGDFEIIIIDDGSCDDTSTIVHRRMPEDPRISIYSNLKRGKVAAFNLAFEKSRGQFLLLLAGDDTLPSDAIATWTRVASAHAHIERLAAYAKLRTMSSDSSRDLLTIPRGSRGNRSGGTTLMSRGLAREIYPIPDELVSEDIWTAQLSERLADLVVECPEVVLNYRIHDGNSNPRALSFDEMSSAIADRSRAIDRILELKHNELPKADLLELESMRRLETYRQNRRLLKILTAQGVDPVSKLRAASMSGPRLWGLRTKAFRISSGW